MTSVVNERRHRLFESNPTNVQLARRFIVSTLQSDGATDATRDAFALIVSELFTNFVEHGDGSVLEVSVVASNERWEIEVSGGASCAPGDPFLHPATWAITPGDHVNGRGLGIVRSLSDDITVITSDGVISVRCRRPR